jgi:hypothetical protein
MNVRRKSLLIIGLGLAIREAFSFWTGHPFDFELWVRTGFWVAHGVSPYGVLGPVPGLTFAYPYSTTAESTIGYLPFWPLILGALYQVYTVVGGGDRFVYYFLLKQPEIIGDILLGFFISRAVRVVRPQLEVQALALWVLSPFTIIISGVWGMFDSLAMLPVIMALDARTESGRSFLEGVAILVKSIPVIFALPFAFSTKRPVRNLAIAVLLPLLASALIILVARWPLNTALDTLQSTITKGGQSISGVGIIYYLYEFKLIGPIPPDLMKFTGYLWVPAELIVALLGYRWYGFATRKGLVQSLLLCAIAFMLFKGQVNEQYGVYILALALVDLSWNPARKWLYVGLTASDMGFLLINNVFLVRFTSPIYPDWSYTEGMLSKMLGPWSLNLEFASTLAFVALNIIYFVMIYMARGRPVTDASIG